MKFLLTFNWSLDTQTRVVAITRFQQAGELPPAGAKLRERRIRGADVQ